MSVCVQSLWIGRALSSMEIYSIRSFLAQGHAFHLYVYDEVQNIPSGTLVLDANPIVDSSRIFTYKEYPSYAGFANLFRYALLHQKGNYWTDLDIFCLRPLDFPGDYFFARQKPGSVREHCKNRLFPSLNNCFMKAQAGSELCRRALDFASKQDPAQLHWGMTGPELLTQLARELHLGHYAGSLQSICPVGHLDWQEFLSEDARIQKRLVRQIQKGTWAVHLWNEMWRRAGVNKDGAFAPECVYERLKRQVDESYRKRVAPA
jgi:hypothetical protein